MRRYPAAYTSSYSFGPGPLSSALKGLIIANVVMFLAQGLVPGLTRALGLMPSAVVERLYVWQLASYMFLHAGVFHLLFNMLVLWMFGTELERLWGTRFFLKYYAVTGVGAAVLTTIFSLLPFEFSRQLGYSIVIGASGAIFGLLLAFGLRFPDRPIFFALLFPIPAKYFVMIIGAVALYSSFGASGGVAHVTHLGGLVVGYLYLRGSRIEPLSELKYHYLKWKFNRARRKFDVHSGGRANDGNRHVH